MKILILILFQLCILSSFTHQILLKCKFVGLMVFQLCFQNNNLLLFLDLFLKILGLNIHLHVTLFWCLIMIMVKMMIAIDHQFSGSFQVSL